MHPLDIFFSLTWIGHHRDAKANTTTTTKRVTRFRPRCDSADICPLTTVRHKRLSIRKYKPLIKINGIKYELRKKMTWKAAKVKPLSMNLQAVSCSDLYSYSCEKWKRRNKMCSVIIFVYTLNNMLKNLYFLFPRA